MNTTAWLIEFTGSSSISYYAADGDWCNNPNHAHKFPTAEEAHTKLATIYHDGNYRVAEHMWMDGPG